MAAVKAEARSWECDRGEGTGERRGAREQTELAAPKPWEEPVGRATAKAGGGDVKVPRPGLARAAVGGVRRRAQRSRVSCSAGRRPPVPASAPPSEFSAERAMAHVEQIAQRPHPVGSADHARVRDYLVGALGALGLKAGDPIHRGAARDDNRAHGACREHPGAHRRHRTARAPCCWPRTTTRCRQRRGRRTPVRASRRSSRPCGRSRPGRPRATTSSCCSPTRRNSACSAPGRSSSSIRGRRTSGWR